MRKYRNKKVEIDGIKFDSQKEAKRYRELKLLERAGEISDLKLQVVIEMQGAEGPILTRTGRQKKYVADFTYYDKVSDCDVIEDVKGFKTPEYEMKRAVVHAMGLEIKET